MKVHLLATNRGEGKTRWLKQQISDITYNASANWLNSGERVVILLPKMQLRQVEHREISHIKYPIYWGTFEQMEIPFCGMSSCQAIFVDEYQKLTPKQWQELGYCIHKSNCEELYLAGDINFTLDQLSRDPNDTEHLYRRLADQEHEINRLKQGR